MESMVRRHAGGSDQNVGGTRLILMKGYDEIQGKAPIWSFFPISIYSQKASFTNRWLTFWEVSAGDSRNDRVRPYHSVSNSFF